MNMAGLAIVRPYSFNAYAKRAENGMTMKEAFGSICFQRLLFETCDGLDD